MHYNPFYIPFFGNDFFSRPLFLPSHFEKVSRNDFLLREESIEALVRIVYNSFAHLEIADMNRHEFLRKYEKTKQD